MRPLSRITVRGENDKATRLFCSTRMIESPLSVRNCLRTALSDSTRIGANPSVGSSMSRTAGLVNSARDRQHLLLAARQLIAGIIQSFPQSREQLEDTRVRPISRSRRNFEVFAHRQRWKNLTLLRHIADSRERPPIAWNAIDVLASEDDIARVQHGLPDDRC